MASNSLVWKWPDAAGFNENDLIPIADIVGDIKLPAHQLRNRRNFDVEFYLEGLTAADDGTVFDVYRANSLEAFDAGNIEPIGDPVTIDGTITANPTAVFIRGFKNVDLSYIRIRVTPAAANTGSIRINLKAGALA